MKLFFQILSFIIIFPGWLLFFSIAGIVCIVEFALSGEFLAGKDMIAYLLPKRRR